MLRPEDFRAAAVAGARSGNRRLVLHYYRGDGCQDSSARVGIVVPKRQVAKAVRRNRIKRRVRALMSARIDALEPGARVVVRALAGADGATSEQLGADLDRLLERCRELHRQGRRR